MGECIEEGDEVCAAGVSWGGVCDLVEELYLVACGL